MMMGQLSQRTLSVIAGKIPSHPEVQGHHLHKSPDQVFLKSSGMKHDGKTTLRAGYQNLQLDKLQVHYHKFTISIDS